MTREKEEGWDSSEEGELTWTESVWRKCRIPPLYRPLDRDESLVWSSLTTQYAVKDEVTVARSGY